MATVAELSVAISAETSSLDRGLATANDRFKSFGQDLTRIGASLSIAVTAPLVLMAKAAISAGSSFESAFAGVRKTVDATEGELSRMRDGFRKLALEIPISANEMAKIGEAAGALGVKTKDILGFTRVMADLGVATNLSSDQAATGLARLATIMKSEAGPQYDRMAASLVALGNAGASTESEILEMSLRIAGAGKQAGLSKADVLGFANALSSVGIEAEAGGSSISRVFIKMADATKLGGRELQVFAQTAGMSAAEFKRAFGQDAAGAAISFMEGLGRISDSGKSLTPILKELELADIRVSDALRRAAGSGDTFRESIANSSKAFAENVAHTKEAAERYKTFDSQLQLVKNQLTDIAITIFDKLRPQLTGMLDAVKGAISGFKDLDENTIKMGVTFLGVAGSAGPIALLIGKLLTLGPGGAVALAVVAGVGVMAVGYQKNFGAMRETVDSFLEIFTKDFGSIGELLDSTATALDFLAVQFVSMTDTMVTGLKLTLHVTETLARTTLAMVQRQWAAIPKIVSEGLAKSEQIQTDYAEREKRRAIETQAIMEGGWRQHFKVLSVISGEGGTQAGTAFDARIRDALNIKQPGMALQEALIKFKGPTIEAARAMGLKTGAEMLGGFRIGIEQHSPSGFEKDLDRIAQAFAAFPAKIQKHIAGLSAAGKLLLKEYREASKGILDSLNETIRSIEIDKLLVERIAPIIEKLKETTAKLREQAVGVGAALSSSMVPAMEKMAEAVVRGNGSLELLIDKMIKAKEASAAAAQQIQRDFEKLSDHFQDLSRSLPAAWNTILDGIIQGSGRTGAALLTFGVKVKGYANDILNVFDTMPGKWGSALRKALDEVNRWVNFLDSAMRLVQRIMGDAQTGLSGVFEKIVGVFKKSTAQTKNASGDWSNALERISKGSTETQKKATSAFSLMGTAIAGFAAGTVIAATTASKAIGAIGGAAMGAFQGFLAGGPLGAVIGGIAGLFGGIFGGGKSAAQKAQEAAAAERVKLDAQQTGQNIINAYMDGIAKALDLAPRIAEFEGVSKAQINKVFKFMERVVNHFLDSAKRWTSENLKKGKEVAEMIGPVFEAMTAIPAAEAAINSSFGVSDAQIDLVFNSLDKIFNRWAVRAEEWIGKQSKQVKKVAERLAPAVNLISPLIQAIMDTNTVKEPTDEQLGIVDRSLDKIIRMVGGLAEKFAKPFLKALENLSEKVQPALELWKSQVELLRATVDVPVLKESDADNVVGGMQLFINKLIAGFSTFNTEGLGRIVGIAQAIIPIAGALKAWADTSAAVRGYTVIAAEAWEAIVTDFNKAIQLMGVLIGQAQLFESMAITLEGYLKSGAQHLTDGIAAMSTAVLGTASALQSAFGHIQGGNIGSLSLPSGRTMGAASATSGASTNITINGMSISTDDPRGRAIAQALIDLLGVGTGTDAALSQFA